MTPTNRPITSREYKLMLNTERFRDRQAGAGLFWKLLAFLVENQGNEVIPDAGDPDKDAEKQRTTWFLDTPGFELQRANVILRVREEPEAKKPFKVTLKFRAPDRYTAVIDTPPGSRCKLSPLVAWTCVRGGRSAHDVRVSTSRPSARVVKTA